MFQRILYSIKLILFFVLLTGPAWANVEADISIDSFSYMADLSSSESSLRRIEFSDEMIKQIQQRNAGDIRVYDANDIEMPAMVRVTRQEQREQLTDLVFYPLYASSGLGDEENIEFNHDLEGNITSIKSQRKRVNTDSQITGYVIDQSGLLPMTMSGMSFKWQQDSYMQMVNIKVETSDDLKSWSRVLDSVVIAQLQFEGNLLSHNQVTVNRKTKKFIKISLINPVDGFQLLNVTGIYNQNAETDYHWLSLGEMKKIDNESFAYSFSSESGISAMKMKFNMQGRNALYSGALYSSIGEKRVLRKRHISQYNITQNGVEINSGLIDIRSVDDKDWIFISDNNAVIVNNTMPEILFAYRKYELVFNAQGNQPYTVAWGNSKVGQQRRTSLPRIIRFAEEQGRRVDLVNMLNSRKNDSVFIEGETIEWKRYVLWVVLALGVMGAGRMAYVLYREVDSAKDN